MSALTLPLNDRAANLETVGGKGMSLIFMTRRGLPVPPGFVLSVAFFEPWLEYVKRTPEWKKVLNSSPEDLGQNSATLKTLCMIQNRIRLIRLNIICLLSFQRFAI